MAANNNSNKSKKAGNTAKKTPFNQNRYRPKGSKHNDDDRDSATLRPDQLRELIRQQATSPAVFSEFLQQLGIKQSPPQQQQKPYTPYRTNNNSSAVTAERSPPYKHQAKQTPERPVFSKAIPAFPQQRPFSRPPPPLPQKNVVGTPLMRTSTSANADVRGATTQSYASSASKSVEYNAAAKLNPIDDVFRRINLPNQRVLVLLRGCPGSGKTTLAKKLKHNGVILSADNYFMIDGQYVFDPLKLPDAHTSVKFQTLEHMQRGTSPIIIDNTNLETWVMEPYMMQAVKLRYFVALIEPQTSWRYDPRVLAKMNSHQVPFGKICEMLQRFDHKVNVHILRKLIQPKIDIYKQRKEYNLMKKQAESSVESFVNANRLPSVSEIMANNQSSKKPEAVPDSGLRKGSPLARSMPQLLGDDSDEDEVGISKLAVNGLSDSLLQPTKVESLCTGRKKSAQDPGDLLSPHMKDLMDIDFIERVNLKDKPHKGNDWKLPPFPGIPLSSTNDQVSPARSKIEAEKIRIHKLITPKALERKSSLDSKEAISVTNLNNGSSTPKPKSAMDTGLEAIRREDAVRALKTHFSAVPIGDLEDLVVQCDGDVHWAANLLLDSGYKWMQKTEGGSEEMVEVESRADTDSDDDDNDGDDDDNESEMDGEIVVRESSDETDVSETDSSTFVMRIDPMFAMQLEHLFGPVGFHVATGSYCGNDLNVELDLKTARKVHTLWARSLAKKFELEEEILKEILKDETYAERLQEVEDAHIAAKLDAEERDPNFPALTTEALLLEAKSKVRDGYPETTGDLASKIKRQQLYDLFPKIDRKAIDNVFDAHNGNMMKTTQAIEASFCPHEVPRLVIAPEMMEDYEKSCLKISQQESLLLNEKKKEMEDLQSVVDPSYEDLRAEATVHYQRRQECFTRAQEAYGKNMTAVASFYSQQGHLHTQKLHEAHKRAKDIILTRMNAGQNENTLDLHMLYVQEAMEVLKNFLDQKKMDLKSSNAGVLTLTLITGKGSHSKGGIPRIKPAVLNFLLRHDYSVCDVNGGVIEVTLTDRDQ